MTCAPDVYSGRLGLAEAIKRFEAERARVIKQRLRRLQELHGAPVHWIVGRWQERLMQALSERRRQSLLGGSMRSILMASTILFTSTNVLAGPIQGAGAGTCGAWLQYRQSNQYHGELHWIQGYISSYNQYVYTGRNPNGIFGSIDHNSIAAWMDNYCRANPLETVYKGTLKLVEELKHRLN